MWIPQRPNSRRTQRRSPAGLLHSAINGEQPLEEASQKRDNRLSRLYGAYPYQRKPNSPFRKLQVLPEYGERKVVSENPHVHYGVGSLLYSGGSIHDELTEGRRLGVLSQKNNTRPVTDFTTSPSHVAQAKIHLAGPDSDHLPSFTPMPPLPSRALNRLRTSAIPSSGEQHTTSWEDAISPTAISEPATHRLSSPIIAFIAVGAACLILGIVILIKIFAKPRQKERIMPSLPILRKSFADEEEEDFGTQESPMFGGKERLTATEKVGLDGPLWTWIQYAKPNLRTSNTPNQFDLTSAIDKVTNSDDVYHGGEHYTETEPGILEIQAPPASVPPPSNRISYRRSSRDVGVAVRDPSKRTSFTGDGQRVLQRSSKSREFRRSQIYAKDHRRDSAYRADSAYEGADVSSPPTYYQPVSTPVIGLTPSAGTEGRARIQSSYFATGTYPTRVSNMPYSINKATKVNLSQVQAQALPSDFDCKDSAEDDRDLGLIYSDVGSPTSSYAPASPQPTLYPDDSLSMMVTKRSKRCSQNLTGKRTSRLYVPDSEGADNARAYGKGLLEMEFDVSRLSMSDIAGRPAEANRYDATYRPAPASASSVANKQTHRGPSPPPQIPSLAQMAFAHANPESYDNYRSPTYSLYGMYGDRKSNAPSTKNF